MPRLQPGQLGLGGAGTGLGHLGEAQVDRVGEDGSQQQVPVVGCRAALEVLEVAGQTGAVIDLQQQFGNLQVWQQAVRLLQQRFGLVGPLAGGSR